MEIRSILISDMPAVASLALAALNLGLLFLLLSRIKRQEAELEKDRTNFAVLERGQERLETALREEMLVVRRENAERGRQDRTEQKESIKAFGDGIERKLADTLSRVGDQMTRINRNLGEMSQVASDVLDLKKVMTNITSRGAWGEARLEAILEDTLTSGQYVKNAQVSQGQERVEFAVMLPGGEGASSPLYLSVDSKFPLEDYQRLLDAQEAGDVTMIAEAAKALEMAIRKQAKTIGDKYINPPITADFAIMFLPAEGLYLEALRRPGLLDLARREYKVAIVGPSTITAFLLSLRMGFTTLAMQKRSKEVWELLALIRKEFGRFGDRLGKAREKLDQADGALDEVFTSVRQMDRKMKRMETIGPEEDATEE
ncbi:MAG: DNA recombination protein RmuC [Nitrospinota bacterium]|nr:DNA recombination protein RmuC [Nitrospinota bacterium]